MNDFSSGNDGNPSYIDVYVGKRLRLRRTLLGLSQAELGSQLGLTFQQIQKYEQGINRIGSSRLYVLSKLLEAPITYFFGELQNSTLSDTMTDTSPELKKDPAAKRETLELVRSFDRIEDENVRASILNIISVLNERLDEE